MSRFQLSRYVQHNNCALHTSVEFDHYAAAKELLHYGIDVNAVNRDGNSALHLACAANHVKMAKLLVKNGASIYAANCVGFGMS